MKCSKCQTDNSEGAKFCAECGQSLQTEKICSQCGKSNPLTSKFCDSCGNSLIRKEPPQAMSPQPSLQLLPLHSKPLPEHI